MSGQDEKAFDLWHDEVYPGRAVGDVGREFEEAKRHAFLAGLAAERARLREKVEAMRDEADEERRRLSRMGYPTEFMDVKAASFGAVLALLDEPGEGRA